MAAGVLKIMVEAAPIELKATERLVRIAATELEYSATVGEKRVAGHVLIVPSPLAVLVELGAERWNIPLETILRAVLEQRTASLESSSEPANPLTEKRTTTADRAVKYVLDRVQTDPDLYYLMVDSEAWEQLTAAEAELLGVDVQAHRSARRKDLQPEYRKREPDIRVYKDFCDRLGIKPTDTTEQIREALQDALDEIEDGELTFNDAPAPVSTEGDDDV